MNFPPQGNKITLYEYQTDKELSTCSLILTNKATPLTQLGTVIH